MIFLHNSFSAVSKPNVASKYSLESSRRDLHNALLCTALESNPQKPGNSPARKKGPGGPFFDKTDSSVFGRFRAAVEGWPDHLLNRGSVLEVARETTKVFKSDEKREFWLYHFPVRHRGTKPTGRRSKFKTGVGTNRAIMSHQLYRATPNSETDRMWVQIQG